MQTEETASSFSSMIKETYRGEGVRGFFKGLLSPVVGFTPLNVLVFVAKERVMFSLKDSNIHENTKVAIAGAAAAVGGTFLL